MFKEIVMVFFYCGKIEDFFSCYLEFLRIFQFAYDYFRIMFIIEIKLAYFHPSLQM
jgi:hypothetical protein